MPAKHSKPRGALTHLDALGRAAMVDVGQKPLIRRTAVAEALFKARPSTIDALLAPAGTKKGEPLAVARIAGVLAAKRCDELIPLCHPLPLDSVAVAFDRPTRGSLRVRATASTTARTGVEMEAIVGATLAAITLYDMAKGIDRALTIEGVRLVEKTKELIPGPTPGPRAGRPRRTPR